MEKFTTVSGVAAPFPAANVDTDVIMPKAFLKRIDKEGVLEGLFHDLRLDADGTERPEFVLNQPAWRNASFLIVGPNFGCGSSREHAVWGLRRRGIRALIGSSFAGIFFDNCANNAVLGIVLPKPTVDRLLALAADPATAGMTIDLASQTITTATGEVIGFDIEPARKEKLLEGLDPVGQTLRHREKIEAFEANYYRDYPWLV